jgi:hypothetical protein
VSLIWSCSKVVEVDWHRALKDQHREAERGGAALGCGTIRSSRIREAVARNQWAHFSVHRHLNVRSLRPSAAHEVLEVRRSENAAC